MDYCYIRRDELQELNRCRDKLAFLSGWLSKAISDDRPGDQLRASIRAALKETEMHKSQEG